MSTYLVPLDGSTLSEAALPWAALLAGNEGTLRLLRCLPAHSGGTLFAGREETTLANAGPDNLPAAVDDYLTQIASQLGRPSSERRCRQGKAAEEILAESASEEVEAVVMSSHGEGGLGKWLVGSVTSKVMHGCTKPVLVVRADQANQTPQLKKIVLCLDGSTLAEKGREWAARLARRHQASLKLVQVVNPQQHSVTELPGAIEQSARYLKGQAEQLPGLSVETTVRTSGVLDGILKESSGYDLTVVTSHGQGGFQRWLLGSLTEKLIHQSSTALLVIPAGSGG